MTYGRLHVGLREFEPIRMHHAEQLLAMYMCSLLSCESMCLRGASLCAILDRVWQLVHCRDQTVSPEIRYVCSSLYYLVSESVCVCVLASTMPKCKTSLCVCVGMVDGSWHCPSFSPLSRSLNFCSSSLLPFPPQVNVQSASLVWC